jgi:hypothetical protein
MNINKSYIVAGLLIAFMLFFEIAAHADERDQATKLTFSGSIQIPGQVLPAGTYLFKIANPDTGRNIVQVFNAEGTVLYATLETMAAARPEPAGETVVTLAEGSGGPDALVKWFYPGNVIGNEFLYSKQQQKELAQDTVQAITVHEQTRTNSETSAVGN